MTMFLGIGVIPAERVQKRLSVSHRRTRQVVFTHVDELAAPTRNKPGFASRRQYRAAMDTVDSDVVQAFLPDMSDLKV
ncbi:MAG TPA: hypothetical protein VFI56_06020, partial [Vicinamibacterales bacterium]|nr:hypothetical protein [Vicinamibacterales bacterium]